MGSFLIKMGLVDAARCHLTLMATGQMINYIANVVGS